MRPSLILSIENKVDGLRATRLVRAFSEDEKGALLSQAISTNNEKTLYDLLISGKVHQDEGFEKFLLDAFSKENPEDVKRLKALQKEVHDTFIGLVKARRGDKLKGADSKLFTGEFWAGGQALKLGLIDGIGDMHTIMKEKLGDDVRFKVFGQERGWLRRRLSGSNGPAPDFAGLMSLTRTSLADDVISALETRNLWQRFGF